MFFSSEILNFDFHKLFSKSYKYYLDVKPITTSTQILSFNIFIFDFCNCIMTKQAGQMISTMYLQAQVRDGQCRNQAGRLKLPRSTLHYLGWRKISKISPKWQQSDEKSRFSTKFQTKTNLKWFCFYQNMNFVLGPLQCRQCTRVQEPQAGVHAARALANAVNGLILTEIFNRRGA